MKIYIVVIVDNYESWDISYHLTRKGALRFIMRAKYNNWNRCRYIQQGSYDDEHMYIRERDLVE